MDRGSSAFFQYRSSAPTLSIYQDTNHIENVSVPDSTYDWSAKPVSESLASVKVAATQAAQPGYIDFLKATPTHGPTISSIREAPALTKAVASDGAVAAEEGSRS